MRSTLIIVITALLLVAGCGGGKKKETTSGNEWLGFNEGMARAKKENKPVVVDFYTTWCKWCKVMDRETFSDPEVAAYLGEHFVSIRIDAENKTDRLVYKDATYSPAQLTAHFGIRGYPSLAYLDMEGEPITIVPGFMPAKTFLPFLEYINKECYRKQISFEEYQKNNGDCD